MCIVGQVCSAGQKRRAPCVVVSMPGALACERAVQQDIDARGRHEKCDKEDLATKKT